MKLTVWAMVAAGAVVAACGGGSSSGGDSGAYSAGPGPQGGALLYSDFRSGKKLILHQRGGMAVTPASLRDRLAAMEAALDAYDGVFLRLPTTGDAVARSTVLNASAIAADLEPLYALRPARLKYNFAVVAMHSELDPFDDWTVAIANFRNVARVARDAGLVGIVIDNENPGGLRVNYPYELKFQSRTIDEYRIRMQSISRQIMEAITAEFPDAAVVVLRGPAGAEAKSPSNLVNCESRDTTVPVDPGAACGANTAQLLGSFFAGFVEARTSRALLVDGGTDYGLRTAEQFAASAAWRKVALPSAQTASEFIPDTLRASWPTAVSVSFGVREIDGAHGNLLPNDIGLWTATVVSALRAADGFVWTSFDVTDLSRAAANQPWVAAARLAKSVAAAPNGTLSPAAPATGTGLMAQYYSLRDESELAQTVVDPYIDNVWTGTGPSNTVLAGQAEEFSVNWTGYIEAPVTGTYTIFGTTDDGMQIFIGSTAVVDSFFHQGPTEHPGTIDLVAGTRYPIKIRWFQGVGLAEAHVWWQPPGGIKEVVPTARLYPVR